MMHDEERSVKNSEEQRLVRATWKCQTVPFPNHVRVLFVSINNDMFVYIPNPLVKEIVYGHVSVRHFLIKYPNKHDRDILSHEASTAMGGKIEPEQICVGLRGFSLL